MALGFNSKARLALDTATARGSLLRRQALQIGRILTEQRLASTHGALRSRGTASDTAAAVGLVATRGAH